MIIAVEGIDGAGKSHLCALLQKRLAGFGLRVGFLEKHTLPFDDGFADRRMAELRNIIWPSEAEPSQDVLGTEFYLFLLAAWFAGLKQAVPRHFEDYDLILTDGSFYRVAAKASVRAGLDLGWLVGLFAQALRPDLVILMDIDPADAWNRRTAFKATELGHWDGFASDNARQSFCGYQEKIRSALLQLARLHCWPVIAQQASTTPDESAIAAERAVTNLLLLRSAVI